MAATVTFDKVYSMCLRASQNDTKVQGILHESLNRRETFTRRQSGATWICADLEIEGIWYILSVSEKVGKYDQETWTVERNCQKSPIVLDEEKAASQQARFQRLFK
jgi:hypothetical protein